MATITAPKAATKIKPQATEFTNANAKADSGDDDWELLRDVIWTKPVMHFPTNN